MLLKKMLFGFTLMFALLCTSAADGDWTVNKFERFDELVVYNIRLNVDDDIDRTVVFLEYGSGKVHIQVIEYQGLAIVSSRTIQRRNGDLFYIYANHVSDAVEEVTIDPEVLDYAAVYVSTYGGDDYVNGGTIAHGNSGDDVLLNGVSMSGGRGMNRITAGPLTKTMSGNSGEDFLDGRLAQGDLKIHGFGGDDVIYGSEYDDYIDAGGGNDRVFARGGDDTIHADLNGGNGIYDGNDWVWGGTGNDTIWGYIGDDVLLGGSGDDQLYGGEDYDVLIGHRGDDLLRTSEAGDTNFGESVYGGDGADRFETPEFYLDSHYNDFDESEGDEHFWLFS